MAAQINLLVADADASVREVIQLAAAEQGWSCECAADGIAALKAARRSHHHLAVVDMDLPEIDGRVVCRQLSKAYRIPVILTGRNSHEENRLAAFAAGGNDFVAKPFYPRELVARIRNLIELSGASSRGKKAIRAGNVSIEVLSHSAYLNGKKLPLSPKEYDLLLFFCQNTNQAFSRGQLLDLVWGPDFEGTDRTVDTHVKSLRSKLKPYQTYIETAWGYGYKFTTE